MGKSINKDSQPKPNEKAFYNAKHDEDIQRCSYTFTSRLKDAREKKGFSQDDMAQKLDISLPAYRKYEQGRNRVDVPHYIKSLADLLDVSADYLVGKSPEPHPEYEILRKSTGLNDQSIQLLQELYLEDGCEEYHGYIDFINCLLGNTASTSIFVRGITPILKELQSAPTKSTKEMATIKLSNYIFDYISKVVTPSYDELYATGDYTPISPEVYCSDDSANTKKKRQ